MSSDGPDIVLSFLAAAASGESICCQRSRFRLRGMMPGMIAGIIFLAPHSQAFLPLLSISYIHICMCSKRRSKIAPCTADYNSCLLQLYEIDDNPKRREFLDDLFAFMQKRGESRLV
jgi:hypothetical protein